MYKNKCKIINDWKNKPMIHGNILMVLGVGNK